MDQSIYISKINKIFHDLYKNYEDKNDLKFYSSEISNLIKDFNRRIKLSKNTQTTLLLEKIKKNLKFLKVFMKDF